MIVPVAVSALSLFLRAEPVATPFGIYDPDESTTEILYIKKVRKAAGRGYGNPWGTAKLVSATASVATVDIDTEALTGKDSIAAIKNELAASVVLMAPKSAQAYTAKTTAFEYQRPNTQESMAQAEDRNAKIIRDRVQEEARKFCKKFAPGAVVLQKLSGGNTGGALVLIDKEKKPVGIVMYACKIELVPPPMTQTQKEERYPDEDIPTAKDMNYIILHKIPHEWARRGSRNEYVLPNGEYVWITNPKSDDMRCYGFVKRIEITFTCRSLRAAGNTAEIARETGTSIIKQSSAKAGRRTTVASAQKKSVAGRAQNAATALLWKQIRSSVGPSTTGTKQLIQNGADPNAKNENGETMLFVVVKEIVTASSPSLEKNRAGTAAVLKTAGAKLTGSEEEKIRELASAKLVKILPQSTMHTRGKDDVVTLLRYGANPNAKDADGQSALANVIKSVNLMTWLSFAGGNSGEAPGEQAILALEAAGATLAEEEKSWASTLLWDQFRPFRKAQSLFAVETLLRNGANPNAKGFNDKSLLLFALEKGANTSKTSCPQVIDALRKAGAKFTPREQHEGEMWTFFFAAKSGDWKTIKKMKTAGFDFGIEDKFGRNVFFFLTDRCDESVIEMFKDSGADINKRAVFALSVEDIFNQLKDAGFANDGTDLAAYKKKIAETKETNPEEYAQFMKLMNDATAGKIAATPLTCAISSGNAEFVRLYLKYGADAKAMCGFPGEFGTITRSMTDHAVSRYFACVKKESASEKEIADARRIVLLVAAAAGEDERARRELAE